MNILSFKAHQSNKNIVEFNKLVWFYTQEIGKHLALAKLKI